VIIFSMLLSSGAGSFASKRLLHRNAYDLQRVLLIVSAGVVVLSAIVPPIVEAGVALPLPIRMLVTVLLIAPVGFVMGMPFPTGLAMLERIMPASVRWAWAINAASSVMGSAAAMFFAIYTGLQMTMLIGAGCYAAAWLFVTISKLREPGLSGAWKAAITP
jgi:hypothetical protein